MCDLWEVTKLETEIEERRVIAEHLADSWEVLELVQLLEEIEGLVETLDEIKDQNHGYCGRSSRSN
jgi:hypothetical protein